VGPFRNVRKPLGSLPASSSSPFCMIGVTGRPSGPTTCGARQCGSAGVAARTRAPGCDPQDLCTSPVGHPRSANKPHATPFSTRNGHHARPRGKTDRAGLGGVTHPQRLCRGRSHQG
jgi:hypothetical protein